MLDGKFLIAEEKYKMIINKKEIVCFGKNRIYFKHKGNLCSAEYGKREDVKDSTIVKHGLLQEESFPRKKDLTFIYGSHGERYTNPKLRREETVKGVE